MAGTPGDEELTEEIYQTWRDQGMDHVSRTTYDVLLAYPDVSDPSLVFIVNETSGEAVFTSQDREAPLEPTQNRSDIIPPFNAYSVAGDISVSHHPARQC